MAQILVSLIFLNLWSKLQTLPEDGFADMRGEYEESEGQQVLRHLKAWHAAAVGLLDGRFRHVIQRLVVGLVEVTPNEPKPLTDEEVIQEYFRRYPNASPEERHFIKISIRENHKAAKFTGTTHAEATLMGLLKSFPLGLSFANHDVEIEAVELLKQLIEPVCLLFLPPCTYLMYSLFGSRLPVKR